jgi:hypothetical protein
VPDAELVVEFIKLDPVNGALQLDARWSFACIARKGAHTPDARSYRRLSALEPGVLS